MLVEMNPKANGGGNYYYQQFDDTGAHTISFAEIGFIPKLIILRQMKNTGYEAVECFCDLEQGKLFANSKSKIKYMIITWSTAKNNPTIYYEVISESGSRYPRLLSRDIDTYISIQGNDVFSSTMEVFIIG